MTTRTQPRLFTGRHLFLILLGMFAVVAAVNFTMATLARKTFSGAVIANGFVANHEFSGWVERAREQRKIGWSAKAAVDDGVLRVSAVDREGASLTGARVRVHLIHPLREGQSRRAELSETAPGHYAAPIDVFRGQWDANIEIEKDGQVVLLRERLFVTSGDRK